MASSHVYKCEFIESVSEDFLCKKCSFIARRLALTSCCGESFCQTCIADILEQGQPCPQCGMKEFTAHEHLRSQKRISCLQVYCSMKERGCVWSGTLDQLDTHLDPRLDNCQYVDTKCPLNCLHTVPKNKVDQHVAIECSKRPHICQHCGFKASYEEVVDTHLPECKYVPLQCPNMCGVSCEREVMEDHMKTCRLEEVECEFSSVGCNGRFIREDQDEHARQYSQKHLTLTASLAVQTKEHLNQQLLIQNNKHKENEEKFKKIIVEQEKKLVEQEKKLGEQEKRLSTQEEKLEESRKEIFELKSFIQKMITISKLNKQRIIDLFTMVGEIRKFELKNFMLEKAKDMPGDWKSPAMYTHEWGYKFCVGVDANGWGNGRNKFVTVSVWSMPGEFDDELEWPANMKLTVELINQHVGENAKYTFCPIRLEKTTDRLCHLGNYHIVAHSKLSEFLKLDTLCFHVSVTILQKYNQ